MSGARRQRPEPVPGQGAAGWQGPRASVVGVPRKLCRLGGAGEISESGVVTEEFFRKSSWREGPVGVPSVGSAVAARQWGQEHRRCVTAAKASTSGDRTQQLGCGSWAPVDAIHT